MDPERFTFYLGKTPAEYTAAIDDTVTLERVLDDLRAKHGARRASDMGLIFLASELRDLLALPPETEIDLDGAAVMGKLGQLPVSDRALVLDMIDWLLQDVTRGARG